MSDGAAAAWGGLTVPIHPGLRIGQEPAAPSNGFNAVDAAHV